MKLNFLKVLNTNKSSTDEIAGEIAALEQKQKECGREYASLTDQAKYLRSRKLCGEAVSEADIRDADRKVESVRLDSEAISETISKLKEKLHDSFQTIKDNNTSESRRQRDSIEGERRKALEEIARAKARLLVAGEVCVGTWAEQITHNGRIYDHDPETQELYLSEVERLRAQLKKPTYHEKKAELERSSRWAIEMNVDDEVEKAIEQHRLKLSGAETVASGS